ncbi:MAG: hypothetical protein ABJN26_23350 [Stappiaceae bacterium]
MSDSVYEKALAHRNKLEAELKDLNHFVSLYEKVAKMPFAQDGSDGVAVDDNPTVAPVTAAPATGTQASTTQASTTQAPVVSAPTEAKEDQPVEEFFRELDEQDREANIIMDDIVEVA